MKEVTLEIPITEVERLGLPPVYIDAEVLRCFRCDGQGFSFACRVRKDAIAGFKQLLRRQHRITHLERLSQERDGSQILLIEGRFSAQTIRVGRRVRLCLLSPPSIVKEWLRFTLVGRAEEVKELLGLFTSLQIHYRILSLRQLRVASGAPLDGLTAQQRRILRLAHALGYYDVPRRISTADLAESLKMDKGTVGEHLRRAEKRIMGHLLSK